MTRSIAWIFAALLATPAQAHDTWFERLSGDRLALGTGNRFPHQESGLDPQTQGPFFAVLKEERAKQGPVTAGEARRCSASRSLDTVCARRSGCTGLST